MSVQITDCTIRDGGYLLNKNSEPKFVKGIMKGLADAGIDFVETGYLQTKVTGETLVYANSVDARKYYVFLLQNTKLMIHWRFVKLHRIKDILCSLIQWIRLATQMKKELL